MTAAQQRTAERFLAAGLADDGAGYPNHATFLAADEDWADESIWRHLHDDRQPVVVVSADHELIITPRRRNPLLRRLDGRIGSTPVLVERRAFGDDEQRTPRPVAAHVGRQPLGRLHELGLA